MLGGIDSLWNKRIVEMLIRKFRDSEDENSWGLPSRSNFYVEDMIKDRLRRLRTLWRGVQCRVKEDGEMETEEEWEARVTKDQLETLKNARHLTRRQNVSRRQEYDTKLTNLQRFYRRMKTAEWMIDAETARNGNVSTWKWLKRLLDVLQAEGMSSDESDIDGYQVVYRVKTRSWRHVDISLCMESIDEQRLGIPSFSKQGAKPVKRIRGGGSVSTRPHVDGLPKECYNQEWMSQATNKRSLRVSDKPFPWLRWRGQTSLGAC